MLLRLKSARVDYEKNLKPCNKKLEDEKFDKSVPEVNGGDYNEDGREGLTCSSLMQRPSLTEYNLWHSFLFRQRQTQVRPSSDLGVGDVICSTSSTNYEGVKKIEVVTVFELNAYVVNSTPHVKSLTVSSSICLITNVPHFLASQVTEFCAPEKVAGATYPALMGSLPACSDLTSAGVVRYRVELCILDGTESAVFVVFYAKISWLTNVHAAEISELMGSICSRTASGELNSVRIIAEEQQLPGAGCPLKKARTE
ncbi:hypothetical protein HID58_002583 [Brassica napus]|uniref:Uncharacterized protein n=1 Tax=Brassica napus TaxID=3708 RepID=A0ABQ8EMP0_BRANA|nr:hypothetical protein HID58_002583 [Brassica napus]